MRRLGKNLIEAFRKGDMILLLLCIIATSFGCLVITSATAASTTGAMRYLGIQVVASLAGIAAYIFMSAIDTEYFSERRLLLVIGNIGLLLLLIPFGKTVNGNRSWLNFPFLPVDIQPAEICKITFILITASVLASHQNNISSIKSVLHTAFHLGLLFCINYFISSDMGVSLIFVFIFVGMTFAGGVALPWFLAAITVIVLLAPTVWNLLPDDNYMKTRIAVLIDPSLDPNGTGPLYQTIRALRSLTGGGLTGQGLFEGNRTQSSGALFAQHTDFIYSAIGEEMGFVGCAAVLVLLFLIIARCMWVGVRSPDTLRRLVCFGVASSLVFQVIVNVGMNIGLMPVIGLTLPFISYGGTSIFTLYAMMGLVSGVYARPSPPSHERYIHPPLQTLM